MFEQSTVEEVTLLIMERKRVGMLQERQYLSQVVKGVCQAKIRKLKLNSRHSICKGFQNSAL